MTIKELRALAKTCNRRIQVKTYNFEDLGRNSKKSINILPSFPNLFLSEEDRLNYIDSLTDEERELFSIDIREIEKTLN